MNTVINCLLITTFTLIYLAASRSVITHAMGYFPKRIKSLIKKCKS